MTENSIVSFTENILKDFRKYNIENVEIIVSENKSLSVKSRNLKLENIERSNNININVNFYKDNRKATLSTNNIEDTKVSEFLDKASAMVNSMPIDKFCGLPEEKDLEKNIQDLDLEDKSVFSEDELLAQAIEAEEVMLENKKITNTEGASRSLSKNTLSLYNSKGFNSNFCKTYHSISSIAIAGKDTNMQRDYDYSSAVHAVDLENPKKVGEIAAQRAVSRLNSKKIKSCTLDIVFEPRVAKSLISSFCSCASGSTIARGTSFLNNKLSKSIFKNNINISNNPKLKKGIGSKPFDNNGIRSKNLDIISEGILKNYFLNLRSSKQLGIPVNGNSSPSNLILEKGKESQEEMIQNIKNGFLVTEMLGMSFNPVNGDYSRGAAGFKIENGKCTFPISEVTIAGNMNEMLLKLTAASDLEINDNINSPSILIEKMTLAGL